MEDDEQRAIGKDLSMGNWSLGISNKAFNQNLQLHPTTTTSSSANNHLESLLTQHSLSTLDPSLPASSLPPTLPVNSPCWPYIPHHPSTLHSLSTLSPLYSLISLSTLHSLSLLYLLTLYPLTLPVDTTLPITYHPSPLHSLCLCTPCPLSTHWLSTQPTLPITTLHFLLPGDSMPPVDTTLWIIVGSTYSDNHWALWLLMVDLLLTMGLRLRSQLILSWSVNTLLMSLPNWGKFLIIYSYFFCDLMMVSANNNAQPHIYR